MLVALGVKEGMIPVGLGTTSMRISTVSWFLRALAAKGRPQQIFYHHLNQTVATVTRDEWHVVHLWGVPLSQCVTQNSQFFPHLEC